MATSDAPIDLQSLLEVPINRTLHVSVVSQIISTIPFIPLPMALNLRTISSPSLPANKIFRSGRLSHLPASTLSELRATYNVSTIFDLRSLAERERVPSPDIEGIVTVWTPPSEDAGTGPTTGLLPVEQFASNGGIDGYIKVWGNVLMIYREVYKIVFEKLRDCPEERILFHCTGMIKPIAGKDRTGVLAALILALTDAEVEDIAHDYALTRIGTEPFREKLLAQLMEMMNMDPATGLDQPGMAEMCGSTGPTMVAFLQWMDEKWGKGNEGKYPGVEGYLGQLGFEKDDLEKIRTNLKS